MDSRHAVGTLFKTRRRRIGSDWFIVKGCNPNVQSASQRRRWESNPLRVALQATASPLGIDVEYKQLKYPRRELNPVFDLRRVACASGTLRGQKSTSAPPRNRTSSGSFEDCHAIRHTRRAIAAEYPDLESEPGPEPSEGSM